jgi:hypothetical protein
MQPAVGHTRSLAVGRLAECWIPPGQILDSPAAKPLVRMAPWCGAEVSSGTRLAVPAPGHRLGQEARDGELTPAMVTGNGLSRVS